MNTNDWRLAEFSPIHVLYGHAARVWDAKVLPMATSALVRYGNEYLSYYYGLVVM